MPTEAETAILVAARINTPRGAAGGSGAHIAAMAAEVTAWFAGTDAGAVTFTDTGDLVGQVGHGLVAGDVVSFDVITTTTGITEGTEYFVRSAGLTADAFTISATSGGTAVALTTNGTGNMRKKVAASAKAILAVEAASQSGGRWQSVRQVTGYAEVILASGL